MTFNANSNMHNTSDIGTVLFNESGITCQSMNGQLDTLTYRNPVSFNSINILIDQTTENGWKFIQLKNIKVYKF